MWATFLQRCPHVHSDCWRAIGAIDKTVRWPAGRVGPDRRQQSKTLVQLQGWQHAGQDFEPQAVLVRQTVAAALDHPDLVVEALDKAERDPVFRPAVSGNDVPMPIDHGGEFLIRTKTLPLQA